MEILVLGNGFDLTHKLPTKYADFFNFIKVIDYILKKNDINKINWYGISDNIKDLIEGEMGNKKDNLFSQEARWFVLIDKNLWIKCFQENNQFIKENWIDFECEIASVIKSLDNDMTNKGGIRYKLNDNITTLTNKFLSKYCTENNFTVQSAKIAKDGRYESVRFIELRDRLLSDLNKLIRALEIYLCEYVENGPIDIISPDIKEIKPDKVLSFNYTDTYETLYGKGKEIEYDYIHGKADIENTIDTNNMVLGIDEYLPDERKNIDIDFIEFKKYFQRIHKETGCRYRDWVGIIQQEYIDYLEKQEKAADRIHIYPGDGISAMINNLTASAIKMKHCKAHNLYIFGHSLDVTDKDILRDLILNNNVQTTIFYYNKDDYGQKIANLVKVISQDELIGRTGGPRKTITFKQQKDIVNIN